jgi:hypothetical protein
VDKTKEMRVNEKTSATIILGTKNIESVQGFTYLGSHVSRDGATLGDVDRRIHKTKGTFARLKNIWRSNNISLKSKIKIFGACVKNVLFYGCQTWMVTEVINRKLPAYVNRCLRRILKIWWPRKISNIDLWRKTNQIDINLEIRRRKFGWLGHTVKKGTDSVPRNALEWNPQGHRR